MIQKQKIKKLAQLAAANKSIPKDIEEFVLTKLSKQELKDFLSFYRYELDNKRLYVAASKELSASEKTMLAGLFHNKELIVDIDKSLGAGLIIKNNDIVFDFSFRGLIDETITKLKN